MQVPQSSPGSRQILDAADISRILARMGHEINERNRSASNLIMIGIHRRGVPLARRLATVLAEIDDQHVPVGALDIAMYRDDIGMRPPAATHDTDLPFDLTRRIVVLVDDVLYTGRTIRAALDALVDFGRPRAIQLAVLVDRGHRELPIRADYVGKNIPTNLSEEVAVDLREIDGIDSVSIRAIQPYAERYERDLDQQTG
jgi:pyrimidine operon attenuation protein/uracil phosphoribosyltransferase